MTIIGQLISNSLPLYASFKFFDYLKKIRQMSL